MPGVTQIQTLPFYGTIHIPDLIFSPRSPYIASVYFFFPCYRDELATFVDKTFYTLRMAF